jgi:hypothetical protein
MLDCFWWNASRKKESTIGCEDDRTSAAEWDIDLGRVPLLISKHNVQENAHILCLAGFLDVEIQQAPEEHLGAQAEELVWNISIRHQSLYY